MYRWSGMFLSISLFLIGCRKHHDLPYPGKDFKRNPKLSLFLSSNLTSKHYSEHFEYSECSYYDPVWAPDGRRIYYLKFHLTSSFEGADDEGAPVWVISLDSGERREFFKGNIVGIAVSSDGLRLALLEGYFDGSILNVIGEKILIVDTSSSVLDTLNSSQPYIYDLEFSPDNNSIFYLAYGGTSDSTGFYKMDLGTLEENFIMAADRYRGSHFDISPNGQIIAGGYGRYFPNIWSDGDSIKTVWSHPLPSHHTEDDTTADIEITDKKGNVIDLNARPYYYTYLGYPSWSPDGNKIIFVATPLTGFEGLPPGRAMYGFEELWVYNLK